MENSISEEESGSDKDSAPESGETEVASENEVPQPFSKKVLWWVAICVLSVVAVVFSRVATPPKLYSEDLALVSFSHFATLIFSFVWFTLFFAVLRRFPLWVRGLILAIFFLPVAFSIYLQTTYGIEINYGFIVDCMNTNWAEAREFFSLHAVSILLGFVAVMFAVAWLIGKIPSKLPKSKVLVAILVAVLAFSSLPRLVRTGIFSARTVLYVGYSLHFYYTDEKQLGLEALAKQEEEPQEVERVPAEVSHVNAVPIVVLHVGESARADHAPFNGYARNTMPNMLREYEAGNLISFPKCVSFANYTVLSMRGMMSPSTVLDNGFRHPTFIPVLNQNGVETCGFCSGFMPRDTLDTSIGRFLGRMHSLICTNELAFSLLPKIREKLAEDTKKEPPQERLYLYYGYGSHIPFTHYDYNRHAVFKPNGTRKYNDERDVNNYDNTFIETDEFCGGFIDALRNENTVYIFVGDHGTMLGEDGIKGGRSFKRKEVRHVLFFVWVSEKFKTENPELWATLLRNRERLDIISHDFVYNSVLHLFSLKTPFYDEKADLFSESAEPFPTEMPEAEEFGAGTR